MRILPLIQQCPEQLQSLRSEVDEYPQHIFQHSCRIADHFGIIATMPCIDRHQMHRSNPEYTFVEEYYKRIFIPFLDHLISELTSRFDVHANKASMIQGLLLVRLSPQSSAFDIEEAVEFYKDDLPNAEIIDEEFYIWKRRWLSIPLQ